MRAVPEGDLLYYEVKKGRYQTLPLNYFKKNENKNKEHKTNNKTEQKTSG